MNNTYNKLGINPTSFEIYQCYKQETKAKKNIIANSKNTFKQAFLSGMNSPNQLKTLYSNYNNFPSLSKCQSTIKLIKAQNNSRLSSQSYFQLQNTKISPSPPQNIGNATRAYNDKSISTLQSTDDRKEIMRLKAELKEKTNLIQTLNQTIENYIKEAKLMSNEIVIINDQLAESINENSKLKQEMKNMQVSYHKLKRSMGNKNLSQSQSKEFKLTEIIELINKEDINANNKATDSEEGLMFEDQSLSAICFTDKVKMEKTISISDNILPTLNFDMIGNINKKDIAIGAEANKQKFKSIENINDEAANKYVSKNNSAILGSYNKQKITFSKANGHKKGV